MALKTNYEKAKKLLDGKVKGIMYWDHGNDRKPNATITTYERFMNFVYAYMDMGKLKKTMEYGWRDGPEMTNVLYTDFIISANGNGWSVGFDAIESYDVRSEKKKYVTPTKKNARFWDDYDFKTRWM